MKGTRSLNQKSKWKMHFIFLEQKAFVNKHNTFISTMMSKLLPSSMLIPEHDLASTVLHGSHSTVVLLAVKCLKRPRCCKERRLIAGRLAVLEALRHPHIVRYYTNNVMSEDKEISLVMEAWGVSVASLISNKSHCGTEHIFNMSAQVLRGLIGLHSAGLVHGDIKPANIVLCAGVYKLCDIDEAGQGSAFYMSAVRARRFPQTSPEDTFSDTYALGMCALEVMTGRQPYYEFENQIVVFAKVCEGQMPMTWTTQARASYDSASDCLISSLLDSDVEMGQSVIRAQPSELLALVVLLRDKHNL